MTKKITFAHRETGIQLYYLDMLIGLLPIIALAVLQSGVRGIAFMALSSFTAVVTGGIFRWIRDTKTFHVFPLITGLLFAFVCPLSAPVWIIVLGSAVAVSIGEVLEYFSLSYFVHPSALTWLLFLLAAPGEMSVFPAPSLLTGFPSFSTPVEWETAESVLSQLRAGFLPNVSVEDLLTGRIAGGFGGVALGAILVSFCYLAARKAIAVEAAVSLLLTVLLFTAIFYRIAAPLYLLYLLQLAGGSLLFGGVFMAPGRGAPKTAGARIAFGILTGALTMILRAAHFGEFSLPFSIVVCQVTANLLEKPILRYRYELSAKRAGRVG